MVEGELVVVKMESDFSEIFDSKFSEFGVKFIIVKVDKPRKKIPKPSKTIVLCFNLLWPDFDFLFGSELKNLEKSFLFSFMLNDYKSRKI